MYLDQSPAQFRILDDDEIASLIDDIECHSREIWQEYFSGESYSSYTSKYFFGDSPVTRAIAYRIMDAAKYREFARRTKNFLIGMNDANLLKEEDELLCHPIFYIRKLDSSVYKTPALQKSFFESQPHFDRTFDVYAYTVWIALRDITSETGGICWFDDPDDELVKYKSRWGEKNVLGFSNYMENYAEIDADFASKIVMKNFHAGHCLLFDSNLLHGGTKPVGNSIRLSFDMRFIPLKKESRSKLPKEIMDFQQNIDLWSALNLLALGDSVGAEIKVKDVRKIAKSVNLKVKKPALIDQPLEKVHWSTEYSWIT